MDARSRGHEEVPDGVREGDEAVALEEDHADHVEDAADCELAHARTLHLEWFDGQRHYFLQIN